MATPETLMELSVIAEDWDYIANDERMGEQLYKHGVAWKKEVNALTNERDLARRANEQNIKIIKNLRAQLRRGK